MIQKKGVAPVISTVLLIVIVVVAVALIVAFVIPLITDSMDKAKACSDATLELESARQNTTDIAVQISRGSTEFDLQGVIIQLISANSKKVQEKPLTIGPFESELIYFNYPNAEQVEAVGIAPIVKLPGKDKIIKCDILVTKPVEYYAGNFLGQRQSGQIE